MSTLGAVARILPGCAPILSRHLKDDHCDTAVRALLADLGLQGHTRRLACRFSDLRSLEAASDQDLKNAGVVRAEERQRLLDAVKMSEWVDREQACFEFASYYATFANLKVNLSTGITKGARFPQYILVGDQSAGKTSVLSRLAKMQLGFVASKTGTRRPFEFTLLFEVTAKEPRVEVDGEDVRMQDLFPLLRQKNDVDGFCSTPVSVKIRSCNLKNLTITDMPGLKDGDNRPEEMLLERLKNPEVTPIVILEPRDMEQKHSVYALLEKAEPPRKRDDIIVLQNKCDMLVSGNWRDKMVWRDHFEGTQKRGFKRIFFTGLPAKGSETEPDEEQLARSWRREETMFREWGEMVEVTEEQRVCMGIHNFAAHLAGEQMLRAEAFALDAGPDVSDELEAVANSRIELERQRKGLPDRIMRLLCELTGWMKSALDGEIDSSCVSDHAQDLASNLEWIVNNFGCGDALPKDIRYPESVDIVQSLAKQGSTPDDERADGAPRTPTREQRGARVDARDSPSSVPASSGQVCVPSTRASSHSSRSQRYDPPLDTPKIGQAGPGSQTSSEDLSSTGPLAEARSDWFRWRTVEHMRPQEGVDCKRFGGAAIESTGKMFAEMSTLLAVHSLRWELTPEWIQNVLGEGEVRDTGNKVIREFMRKLMHRKIQPLIDVAFCLICQHMDRIADAVLSEPYQGHPWSPEYAQLVPSICGAGRGETSEQDAFREEFIGSCKEFFRRQIGEVRAALHQHIEWTTDRLEIHTLSCIQGDMAESLTRNTTGVPQRADNDSSAASWRSSDEWQKEALKQLATKGSRDSSMDARLMKSIDTMSSGTGNLSDHSVEGVGLSFSALWKKAAEVVFFQIKFYSDDFCKYMETAKKEVKRKLESELQIKVGMNGMKKIQDAWRKRHRENLDRLSQMEKALRKAQEVYEGRISR